MRYGDETLWGENEPLEPPKRRSWKVELVGVGLIILGIVCGVLGYKLGGARNTILVAIGIGIAMMAAGSFLISWGGGRRVVQAIGSALATILLLAGLTALVFGFSTWPGNSSSDPTAVDSGSSFLVAGIGFGTFVVGLLVASGRLTRDRMRSSQWSYYQMKAEDVERQIEESEERSRIDQELKGR